MSSFYSFDKELFEHIHKVPIMPLWALIYMYTLSALIRCKNNRTETAMQIKVPIRTFKYRLIEMQNLDYDIPKGKTGNPRRKREI